jgi:ABC-2 type transport system permease protein
MNLWRLEVLRLVRTRRAVALGGVYVFFGLVGPLLARYMDRLLANVAGDVQITVPPPTPAAGIAQFSSNAQQIGLLVVLVVAAGALAFDAKPEIGAFFRTRVTGVGSLLFPRFTVAFAAAGTAFTLGALAAWYQTAVLIGAPPAAGMLAGIAYGIVYLGFAVAVTAMATAMTRTTLTAVAVSIGTLLALPLAGLLPHVAQWLPSHLVGALDALAAGATPATDYLRATAVAVAASAALLASAARLLQRREI